MTPRPAPPQKTSSGSAAKGTGSTSGNGSETGERTGSAESSSGSDGDNGSSSPAGAIAGGVIGGLAVIGIAAAAIVWIVLRHKRKQKQLEQPAHHNAARPGHDSYDTARVMYEKEDLGVHEMNAQHRVSELSSPHLR